MYEKQTIREKERLYLDDKRLVTSKPILDKLNNTVRLFKKRPADNQFDLDLCKADDRLVGQEIDRLNMIIDNS